MAVQPLQKFALEKGAESGFIRYFLNMPQKPATTVRLFDRTEYYTVHGEDALLAAKLVFHTNSVIKQLGAEQQVPSVILSKINFEVFVRELLLVRLYRVEVYCPRGKGGGEWVLQYKASPGNLQQLEEVVFGGADMTHSSLILALRLGRGQAGRCQVGVASADQSTRTLRVTEFTDNDQLSELQACMVQLGPKECLLSSADSHLEAGKVRQMLSRCNILITDRKKAEFSAKDIVQDLNCLLKLEAGGSSSTLPELDLRLAMEALSALIGYLELLSDDATFGCYQLHQMDAAHHLRLDAAAAAALGLELVPGEPASSSLLGALNKCRTAQGQRLMVQWMKQPLVDKTCIEERLDLVESFFSDTALRTALQQELRHLPDFHRLARKFKIGKGTLQDTVQVYQAVQRLSSVLSALQSHAGPHSTLLEDVLYTPLNDLQEDFGKFLELVEATVDLEAAANSHEFVVKPSMDENLQKLHEEMCVVEGKVQSVFRHTASELSLEPHKTIKLESNSQLGHFLRVTKKVEKCLRGQHRYTVLETRNDGVRFTSPKLRTLSDEYRSLQTSYLSQQASLAEEVLAIAAGYTEPLESLSLLLAKMDVLVSFAHVSASAPVQYVRPTITPKGEGDIVLEGCRHPCLELQDNVSFIPNDVRLVRGKDMFQIITGPNMGGKSTYIRQIGVVVLMAQVGCFVPCSTAQISLVDRILARVGAGDSQVKGVSTFMAEMLEAAAILNTATSDSLVIIDELGRGTSTYDGFGLAWAIADHIAGKIGCFCLFATHFHEMTSLADIRPTVSNRHVSALTNKEGLTLLYRVEPGVCDQSFGIYVAEIARFPARVIEFARKKAQELECHYYDEQPQPPVRKKLHLEEKEEDKQKEECEEERLAVIDSFLTAVSQLPPAELEEEEAREKLRAMVRELSSSGSAYISAIMES